MYNVDCFLSTGYLQDIHKMFLSCVPWFLFELDTIFCFLHKMKVFKIFSGDCFGESLLTFVHILAQFSFFSFYPQVIIKIKTKS